MRSLLYSRWRRDRPGEFRALRSPQPVSQTLEGRAIELANAMVVAPGRRAGRSRLSARVRQNGELLERAYRALGADVRQGEFIESGSEWLLDNFHVVTGELRHIERDLPVGFYRRLPVLAGRRHRGRARIETLAVELIRYGDSRIDRRQLVQFLHSFQTIAPLTIGELWAWPSALKLALIESLRRLAEDLLDARDGRRDADRYLERLGKKTASLSSFRDTPRSSSFVAQVLHRSREYGEQGGSVRAVVEEYLQSEGMNAEEAIRVEHRRQAVTQVSLANAVMSLRLSAELDWSEVVEAVSVVDEALRRDPAGAYTRMDFLSRDRQRRAIESLAPVSGPEQVDVALTAIDLAREATGTRPIGARETHVGYYLVDRGRKALERAIGHRVSIGTRWRRFWQRHSTLAYLGSVTLLTALFTLTGVFFALRRTPPDLWLAALVVLLAIPASEVAIFLVNRWVASLVTPRRLLRLEFKGAVPPTARTLVVVPTLFAKVSDVETMVEHVEVLALGNLDPCIHFAILSDLPDADAAQLPGDEAIIQAARAGVERLSRTLGDDKFFLFHRERRWNEAEARWMGWERKRGKLEELNRLLRGATDTSYVVQVGRVDRLRDVRYCLTLDSDTRLPRDAAKALIGVIEHPLNRPRIDPTLGRVTEGYGILQPRVSVTMSSAAGSRFARLYAGHTGVDPYTTAISDVYQDIFDEGIFTGKGLYDVDAFTASLEGRVPENSLLSHDLFEGVHARTALVSDVEVVDDYPSSVLAHARRQHRWVRGDWQILQWLWPIVPTRDGYARNRLSVISRWKILDNLRRSLVPPATLLMFLFGWTVLPGPAWAWTVGALVPLAIPAYAWLIDVTRGRSPGEPWRVFWRTMLDDLGTALARMGLQLTFLAQQAWEMAHAVVLTLIRMTWTHRQLLEWETAASMAGKMREGTSRLYWMRMVASPAIAGAGASLVLAFGPEAWPVAVPVLALWALAPLVALLLSRPIVIRRDMLTGRDRQFVLDVAQRTWRYFEVFAVEADRHLPPDNVQMQPETRVAQRTSPTNIGLGLVAVVVARELGFIDDETCLRRLDASLASVESLERHSGHLLNWYETVHGTPLRPAYISTVDSGNFVGCLMTVQGALRSRYADARRRPPEVAELLSRLGVLVDGTDFRMLYHESRGLFTIGYRLPDHDGPGGPDPSFYDLLASEARLASFIAIAKGDVPQSHWFRLGRSLTSVRGTPVLLSWSASMFEYLMPLLFQRLYPETLLDQSSRAVVERQQRYGVDRSVPWGISESAYAVTDRHGTFQYKAFGLPGLGLKRGLADELVVAPYATALAAMIAPSDAVANLRHLAKEKLLDEFGFFDAIDYTARTPGDGEVTEETSSGSGRIVPSYFAHHQGMTLAALANVLIDDVVVSWFHHDPRVQATELLLQERVPRQVAAGDPRPPEDISALPSPPPPPVRRVRSPHTAYPHAQFLSNGDCVSVVTHAGGGHLSFKGLHVTRARPDATLDPGSQYIYLRDVRESLLWSATYQPTAVEPDDYGVTLASDGARFYRRDGELTTRLDVAVSSEDDVEVRMLLITNIGGRAREIDVTTYVELALSAPAPDLAHPAFGKLFVQTEALPDIHALIAHRRPRGRADTAVWAFHVLSQSRASGGSVEWDTDRARFIGRGRTLRAPAALDGRALSATEGLVLDPIFSLRQRVRLRPGASVRLCVSTGIAPDRATAHGLAHKYHQFGNARQAFMQAATDEHARLRHLDVSADDAILFDRLASRVLYEDRSLRAEAGVLAANTLGQPGLWRFAISGDLPILLVRVSESDDASLVRECLQAQEYWRLKGLVADLVVINEHPPGYVDEVHAGLVALLDRGPWRTLRHQPGGVYLLRADEMSDVERTLVASVARAVLEGSGGGLRSQLDRPYARRLAPPPIEPAPLETPAPGPMERPPVPTLRFGTELGGFTEDGREFVVVREGGRQTPLPWVNVMASPTFGTVVTEAGSAHTWAINSRENRLTPFANDPVLDPTGEAWYIRDTETGEVWCPTPGPVPIDPTAVVVIRHGAGHTTFSRVHAGIATELEVAVDGVEPVKVSRLTLANRGDRPVNLTLCAYCEWVLGPPVARVTDAVVTAQDAESDAVFATRAAAGDFAGRVAFAAVSLPVVAVTADRRAFLGRHGSTANPAALRSGTLDGRVGAGFDPCAALQSEVTLQPGESLDVVWLIGQAADATDARRLIAERRTPDAARRAIDDVRSFWDGLCGQVTVTTPDDSFDVMLNRWLLYQTVSCRIWSRSGYHQPGGAFGYRDQLQDVLSLLMVRPALTREHILRAAAHQFVEGDVQHWWHEPSGRGLRTRCSDDMLWLPFAVLEYVMVTGDAALLDVQVPFIEAPVLAPGEDDIFGEAAISSESGTIYEHCVRAIAHGFTMGAHGLPLIGSGDWNDGMNRVGEAGRGESTWLGFFLFAILTRFAPVARVRGDVVRAERYETEASRLSEKLELAWDGQWFRRGYYDDGTPLGSAQNDECKIDAISQSWAVLSGAVSPQHAERAMDAVRERLIQRGAGVILLLDPPFDRTAQDPGYIKAYPPGVRENGGQYTHAATWTLMALAALGYGDEAVELFHMINPVNRTRRAADVQRYKLEPYVMAGDVYSRPPHAGRGGWSWYTGSSGWMYRVGLEYILGIRRRGDHLDIDPCIPASWPEFSVRWRHGSTEYDISVLNPDRRNRGVSDVSVDGRPSSPDAVVLSGDGGVHRIVVTLGEPARPRESGTPRTAERSPAASGPAMTFRSRR